MRLWRRALIYANAIPMNLSNGQPVLDIARLYGVRTMYSHSSILIYLVVPCVLLVGVPGIYDGAIFMGIYLSLWMKDEVYSPTNGRMDEQTNGWTSHCWRTNVDTMSVCVCVFVYTDTDVYICTMVITKPAYRV